MAGRKLLRKKHTARRRNLKSIYINIFRILKEDIVFMNRRTRYYKKGMFRQ